MPRFEPILGRPTGPSAPDATAPAIPAQRPAPAEDKTEAERPDTGESSVEPSAAEGAAADSAEADAAPAAVAEVAQPATAAKKVTKKARPSKDRGTQERAAKDAGTQDAGANDGGQTEDGPTKPGPATAAATAPEATATSTSAPEAPSGTETATPSDTDTATASKESTPDDSQDAKSGTPLPKTETSTAEDRGTPQKDPDPAPPTAVIATDTISGDGTPSETRARDSEATSGTSGEPAPRGGVASYSATSDGVRSEEFRIQDSATGDPWSEDDATAVAPMPILGDGGPVADRDRARPARGLAGVVRSEPGAGLDERRKRFIAVAVAVVVLVAAVVFMMTRGAEDDGAGRNQGADQATTGPASTASAAAPPAATATGEPTAPPPSAVTSNPAADQRPQLPAGWREHVDRTGFSVYVPAHWRESREGTMVYFRGDGRVLGIDQTDQPKPDPVADWTAQRNQRLADGDFPGYNEIRIAEVPYFKKAADWEFTYNNGSTHVSNRGVIVGPSRAYGFWWQTSGNDWAAAAPVLQIIYDSFRPDPSKVG